MPYIFIHIFSDFFRLHFYFFIFLFLSLPPPILRESEDPEQEIKRIWPSISSIVLTPRHLLHSCHLHLILLLLFPLVYYLGLLS